MWSKYREFVKAGMASEAEEIKKLASKMGMKDKAVVQAIDVSVCSIVWRVVMLLVH